MAQTGYTPISIYYSATASNTPTAGNLVAGELAINTADGKLFYKDSAGVVQTIATKATAALPTTTTGSGSIVLATSPSITTPALSGSTSGSVTLAVPAVAGSNTATFPASTGTVMVSGAMPAFRAYSSGAQSIANSTYTKITLNNENFDTNNNFDSTTNYRFTPTIAGYYQINGQVFFIGNAIGQVQIAIYKNGTQYNFGSGTNNNVNIGGQVVVSDLVYMNGTTDYVELWGWQGSGGNLNTFTSGNYMSGYLARTA